MTLLFALMVALLTVGCSEQNQVHLSDPTAKASVQLFNEAVLGSSPTDAIPMLLTNESASWLPKQIILDYKDGACYGAMVNYERRHSFEFLRAAINARFAKHERPTFANDPTMGIWRMDEKGFSIQLSDGEDEDSFLAIYILFVDPETIVTRLKEMNETDPELFDDFPLEDLIDGLHSIDPLEPEAPNSGQPSRPPENAS